MELRWLWGGKGLERGSVCKMTVVLCVLMTMLEMMNIPLDWFSLLLFMSNCAD